MSSHLTWEPGAGWPGQHQGHFQHVWCELWASGWGAAWRGSCGGGGGPQPDHSSKGDRKPLGARPEPGPHGSGCAVPDQRDGKGLVT